ncbi:HVO_0234 family beta-propeller protein [Halonotius roseus]|uniref:HVO-0234-like beta-propeller domain-containing protein n=1 Tax=Halonotius roseus TaxID=2511997 RepID=A0A544QNF7_9EURY|nr:hypothetical protein [Halonotius roseus]TQQ80449.1 hypothetical protein EWF95_08140 [Halonotius roseus]
MQTLTEKRVFGAKTGVTDVFVATDAGLAAVTVSADQIGAFGLASREPATAVAATADRLVVGTDDGLLAADIDAGSRAGDVADPAFESIGGDAIGSVAAVDLTPEEIVVADSNGVVYSSEHAGAVAEPPAWEQRGTTDGVRAIDAGLLAATDGVYRIDDDGVTNTGLTDVRAVTGVGQPLAATADGLFRLGNGWQSVADGAFRAVAADGHGHAHAVGEAGLLVRAAEDGAWTTTTPPVEAPVVDLAADRGIVVGVTDDGTLCVTAGDGWRHQRLGLPGARGVAIGGGADGS